MITTEAVFTEITVQEFFEEAFVGEGGDIVGGSKFKEYWQ
jgi:hypothetical protein